MSQQERPMEFPEELVKQFFERRLKRFDRECEEVLWLSRLIDRNVQSERDEALALIRQERAEIVLMMERDPKKALRKLIFISAASFESMGEADLQVLEHLETGA